MHSHMSNSLRLALTVGSILALTAPPAVVSGQALADDPAQVGAWSGPFEEGGAETPRCARDDQDIIFCKPTAVSMAALKDGRVLYYNGIEGDENVEFGYLTELGPASFNDRGRVMDLGGGSPRWAVPVPEDGGAVNPNIQEGANVANDPMGSAGVPGRPGDGLVGSTVGSVVSHNPTNPTDDPGPSDGHIFCADVAQLADGRVLIVGGTDYYNEPQVADENKGDPEDFGALELEGLRNGRLYDPASGRFTQTQPMRHGRWYPSLVTMPDGTVTAFSGVTKLIKDTQLSQVRRSETYDPATNAWTVNFVGPKSETTLPLVPRLNLMPNGKVFYNGVGQMFGPFGQAADELLWLFQQQYDPQTKTWEMLGLAPLGARGGAFQAMLPLSPPYDRATLLTFGGALGPSPSTLLGTPFTTLTTVTRDGKVSNSIGPNLNNRRWFSDGIVLPDGNVLATSGNDKDALATPGLEMPVHQAELYVTANNRWVPMASAKRDRVYHNSAMLLADGRVLVGGHSPVALMYTHHRDLPLFANNDKDPSFEIYSPPYLFRGQRPDVRYAPSAVRWGQEFRIETTHAGEISSVSLVRLPSPQHNIDSDQRSVNLEFRREGSTIVATAPPTGVVAPPGYYYLFVNRDTAQGPVPSVAPLVKVGSTSDPAPAPEPLQDSTVAASRGSATPTETNTLDLPGSCSGCVGDERRSSVLRPRSR